MPKCKAQKNWKFIAQKMRMKLLRFLSQNIYRKINEFFFLGRKKVFFVAVYNFSTGFLRDWVGFVVKELKISNCSV